MTLKYRYVTLNKKSGSQGHSVPFARNFPKKPEHEVGKLDKKEYNLKLEEIDKYVNQGNYSEAAKIADSIDWRRVRNVRTLCMVSEIYEADNRMRTARNCC